LAKSRVGYCRTRCIPSPFDTDETAGIGIASRPSKDELTDRRLSLKNEDASATCQPTMSKAKRRFDLAQPQTHDISFDGEVTLDVFHYQWPVIVAAICGSLVTATPKTA